MKNYWFIADTHFSHKNVLTFRKEDGTLLRPGFSCIEEMDEVIIERWNAVVRPGDYVYHLGDVTFDYAKFDIIAPRLVGQKRLVLGNHDKIKGTTLLKHFVKLDLWKAFPEKGIIATHIPLDPRSFRGDCTRNVHGHIHHKSMNSSLHACVSVERTNYTPVNLDEIDDYFGKPGFFDRLFSAPTNFIRRLQRVRSQEKRS